MLDLSRVELVIFDCDGVLVDSETLAAMVLAKHVTLLGWGMDTDECQRRFKGRSLVSCGKIIERRLGKRLPVDFFVDLQEETFAYFERELCVVEGVECLLASLLCSSCVASSGNYDKLSRTLGKTGLASFFSGRVYSAEEVTEGKPAPDIFLFAAEKMGVGPDRCLVVEDSLPGIEAAMAAGMQSVYFVPQQGEYSSLASVAVNSMAQLQQLLITAGLADSE